MRLKTAYRKSAEKISEPNIPEIKIDGEKVEPDAAISVEQDDDQAVTAAIHAAAEADESKLALVKQIEALRESEALQRQHHAAMAAAQAAIPTTREGWLEAWRQQGLPEAELEFLAKRPAMIDRIDVTQVASAEALHAGHERDSPEFFAAVERNFENHMKRESTPEFFKPERPAHSMPSPASFVSAPVSREIPSASGVRVQSPNRMTLTPDELLIAKASGISATEYAKNKLRLEREKRAGQRQ